MKILTFIALLSLFSCASRKSETSNGALLAEQPPVESCMMFYDLKKKEFSYVSDTANCYERYPAASTFKIPLAVMAFEEDILKDQNTLYKWDKIERPIPAWNRDHTAESWMRDSVVWYSQRITPKLGEKKIEEYLKYFRYGNQDMSSGVKFAWLTPSPFMKEPMSNSLRISAVEQAYFLRDLWWGILPRVTRKSQREAKRLLAVDKKGNSILRGKTGSGYIGEKNDLRIGWFVGHLRSGQQEYIVISNFVDKQKPDARAGYGGYQAKDMLLQELQKRNLW